MISFRGKYTIIYDEHRQLTDVSWVFQVHAVYKSRGEFNHNLLEESIFLEITGINYDAFVSCTHNKFDQLISMLEAGVDDHATLSTVVNL